MSRLISDLNEVQQQQLVMLITSYQFAQPLAFTADGSSILWIGLRRQGTQIWGWGSFQGTQKLMGDVLGAHVLSTKFPCSMCPIRQPFETGIGHLS